MYLSEVSILDHKLKIKERLIEKIVQTFPSTKKSKMPLTFEQCTILHHNVIGIHRTILQVCTMCHHVLLRKLLRQYHSIRIQASLAKSLLFFAPISSSSSKRACEKYWNYRSKTWRVQHTARVNVKLIVGLFSEPQNLISPFKQINTTAFSTHTLCGALRDMK